jgi:hypothetical protein
MADTAYKVLILGAGASHAYGFPLGGDLRQRILNLPIAVAKKAGIVRERTEKSDIGALTEFQVAFRHSQMYSIDAFLGRRREFAEIGKKCIAAILLECEGSDALFSEGSDRDHWYQYLFNQFAQRDWDELTFNDIAIVSFNYDRSLEHFLYVALQSTYGKCAEDAAKKLKLLRIVHVYGSLCDEMPGSDKYLRYDGQIDMDKVEAAAKGLVVIPEGRIDSPTLIEARKWLEDAKAICFLGFGFDPMNVERLSENEACAMWKLLPTGHTARNIVGTCFGMTKREISAAFGMLTYKSLHEAGEWRFLSTTCTQLLRETLFLKGQS